MSAKIIKPETGAFTCAFGTINEQNIQVFELKKAL